MAEDSKATTLDAYNWSKLFGDVDSVTKEAFLAKWKEVWDTKTYSPAVQEAVVSYVIADPGESKITSTHYARFLARFGPYETCMKRVTTSLFKEDTAIPHIWFHGLLEREEMQKRLEGGPGMIRTLTYAHTYAQEVTHTLAIS